jgi:3D (Asp-Asp-Asp) domain-containing protein
MIGTSGEAQAQGPCRASVITGYSAEQYPGRTADGTSTWGALAAGDYIAAGPSWMLGQRITVRTTEGDLVYRIADTGLLAAHGIDYDLLFPTTAEALRWGRRVVVVCVGA